MYQWTIIAHLLAYVLIYYYLLVAIVTVFFLVLQSLELNLRA
ncbi:hypothetical protein [Enterobacter intestinihominis]